MIVTRNTGADLLPFGPRQRRAEERDDIIPIPRPTPQAVKNAQARREREAPPPSEAYTSERLRRDLASLPLDVVLNDRASGSKAATRQELRRRGWTDERLRRAMIALRDDLAGRVHPPTRAPVTAGAVPRGTGGHQPRPSSPPPAVAPSRERTWGEAQIARFGVVYPRSAGSLRNGSPDRPFQPDPEPVDRRNYPAGSRTRLPANRRSSGGARPRRSGWQS